MFMLEMTRESLRVKSSGILSRAQLSASVGRLSVAVGQVLR